MPFDLKQVLEIIEGGHWFSCSFITANQAKGTGGEAISLKMCRLSQRQQTASPVLKAIAGKTDRKNPLHHYHFTRNLELENGQMRKVHPLLIFKLNGQPVI